MHRRPDFLPDQMQGRWIDLDDGSELVIRGFDVSYCGREVAHDFFVVEKKSGALSVRLGVDDPAREDSFQKENLAGLVIDPEGAFHAYNTRFGASFERATQ